MRKLVLKMQMSLDGFVAKLDGDVGFIFTSFDDALTYWIVQDIWKAGTHIMGRRTYEDMAAWWPKSTEPFAPPMNLTPKAVFSDTLEEAHWGPVQVIRGDLVEGIAYLKSQGDKDIYAHGGAGFARALIAAGVVDEYHLITHPVVLGRGLAIFSGSGTRDLELVESKSFPKRDRQHLSAHQGDAMTRLNMFNSVSLDGYFTDANSDMRWAHEGGDDAEFQAFVAGNAQGKSALVFGRVTYEMMASFWPTPAAAQAMPDVAKGMNAAPKYVFSRSLKKADWSGTSVLNGDPAQEIARLKRDGGTNMTILGSGSIVAQLAAADLIDDYQFMLCPAILGGGRTLFGGVAGKPALKLENSRTFKNGKVFLHYTR